MTATSHCCPLQGIACGATAIDIQRDLCHGIPSIHGGTSGAAPRFQSSTERGWGIIMYLIEIFPPVRDDKGAIAFREAANCYPGP